MEIKIDLKKIALKYGMTEEQIVKHSMKENYAKIVIDTKEFAEKTYLEIHNSNIDVLDKLNLMSKLQTEKERVFRELEEVKKTATGSTSTAINQTARNANLNANVAFAQQIGGR